MSVDQLESRTLEAINHAINSNCLNTEKKKKICWKFKSAIKTIK